MAGFATITREQVLKHLFGIQVWPPAPPLYLGLFVAAPTKSGGTEVTGGGYARRLTTPAEWTYSVVSDREQIANNVMMELGPPTTDWGAVNGAGLWGSLSGGTLYVADALVWPVNISTLGKVRFEVGKLIIRFPQG